jgi:hypothetical protein
VCRKVPSLEDVVVIVLERHLVGVGEFALRLGLCGRIKDNLGWLQGGRLDKHQVRVTCNLARNVEKRLFAAQKDT